MTRASAYLTPRRAFRRCPRLLRTAELNAVGRSAVVLLCLTGAGVAHVAARAIGSTSKAAAPVGALACLAAVVAIDRQRWNQMETGYGWTDDADEVAGTAAMLQRHGILVRVEMDIEGGPRLRYHNRDCRRVRRELNRAGLPVPIGCDR